MQKNLLGSNKPSPTATPFVPSFSPESPVAADMASSSSTLDEYFQTKERVNLPPGRVTCKFYMKGYCSRGSACWYAHDAAAVPIPMIVEDGGKRKVVEVNEPKGKEKMKDSDTLDAAEDESECCAICFESPTTYGLLTNCDHVFCLACIRSWRSSGNKNENAQNPLSPFQADDGGLNKTSKTCPLCRVRSKFIVPSSIFPTPLPGRKSTEDDLSLNPAKEAIVQRYLDKLGTIPCRYFQDSLNKPGTCRGRGAGSRRNDPMAPFCPFGNECHYAHLKGGEKYVFSDREISNHRRSRAARANRNRASGLEQMVFGRYAAGGRQHPLFHANGPDAQAFIEMILEGDRSEWDIDFDHFNDERHIGDEIDRYEFIDENERLEVSWNDHPDDDSFFNVADLLEAIDSRPPREGLYPGAFEGGGFNNNNRPRTAGARGYSARGRGNRHWGRRAPEAGEYLNNVDADGLD